MDDNRLHYVCGDCGERRQEAFVELVEHSNDSLGSYPICIDTACSIENVSDPTESDFKVTDSLE